MDQLSSELQPIPVNAQSADYPVGTPEALKANLECATLGGSLNSVIFRPKDSNATSGIITNIVLPKGAAVVNLDVSAKLPPPDGSNVLADDILMPILVPLPGDAGLINHEHTCMMAASITYINRPHGCVSVFAQVIPRTALLIESGIVIIRPKEERINFSPKRREYTFDEVTVHYLVPALLPNGATCYVCFSDKESTEDFMRKMNNPIGPWLEVGALVWHEPIRSFVVYYQPG